MQDLKKYEYVIAIAREGGISPAAEALNIAQPTLSKYVRKLEAELGVELFDRSRIPMILTEAGECFVKSGRRFIDMEHQLQKQLSAIKRDRSTVVRVGISPSRSPYLMPAIIERYRRKMPHGRITVREGGTAELDRMLYEGELDLMISLADETDAEFEAVPLFNESLLLAVPESMIEEGEAFEELLRRVPLINVGKGSALWKSMNDLLEPLGVDDPEIECQSVESALALVKRGIGAMLAPSYVAKYGSAEQNGGIRFLPIPKEQYPEWESLQRREVCLFYRKEQFLSQSELVFIDSGRDAVENGL